MSCFSVIPTLISVGVIWHVLGCRLKEHKGSADVHSNKFNSPQWLISFLDLGVYIIHKAAACKTLRSCNRQRRRRNLQTMTCALSMSCCLLMQCPLEAYESRQVSWRKSLLSCFEFGVNHGLAVIATCLIGCLCKKFTFMFCCSIFVLTGYKADTPGDSD